MLLQMTGADLSSGTMVLAPPGGGSSSSSFNSHRELLGNMQKFLSQVSNALQQLNGDVTLQVIGRLCCVCISSNRHGAVSGGLRWCVFVPLHNI